MEADALTGALVEDSLGRMTGALPEGPEVPEGPESTERLKDVVVLTAGDIGLVWTWFESFLDGKIGNGCLVGRRRTACRRRISYDGSDIEEMSEGTR